VNTSTSTQTPAPGAPTATATPTRSNTPQVPVINATVTASTDTSVSVTINGSNFAAGAVVILDPAGSATQVTPSSLNSTSITFTLPASMLAGTYSGFILVRNPGGNADSVAKDLVIVAGPVPTATFTAGTGDGELVIDDHRCWPNPIVGGNLGLARVAFHLKGHADNVSLKVYTRAWICVGSADSGAVSAGWTHLPLPSAFTQDAGAGTYYYVLSASRGGAKTEKHSVGKLTVLR
jgi:hypothetical protein